MTAPRSGTPPQAGRKARSPAEIELDEFRAAMERLTVEDLAAQVASQGLQRAQLLLHVAASAIAGLGGSEVAAGELYRMADAFATRAPHVAWEGPRRRAAPGFE